MPMPTKSRAARALIHWLLWKKTIHRLPALSHTQSGGFARVQELVPAELRRIITRHGTPAFAAADVMRNAAIRRRRV
jgi:hypothetical protein